MKYFIITNKKHKILKIFDSNNTISELDKINVKTNLGDGDKNTPLILEKSDIVVDETIEEIFEADISSIPVKGSKPLYKSTLFYDGTKFYTEYEPDELKCNSAIYQAHEDCNKKIRKFSYKDHEVDLNNQNQKEYRDGVLLVLLLSGDIDNILPLPMRFSDGDYVFQTVGEVKEFFLQSAIHVQSCYSERKIELDRIKSVIDGGTIVE